MPLILSQGYEEWKNKLQPFFENKPILKRLSLKNNIDIKRNTEIEKSKLYADYSALSFEEIEALYQDYKALLESSNDRDEILSYPLNEEGI